jgi:hypothetical protein
MKIGKPVVFAKVKDEAGLLFTGIVSEKLSFDFLLPFSNFLFSNTE